jgi:chromosome segregation ATPase
MSARAAARKPAVRGNSGLAARTQSTDGSYDDDSRAEHAQLVEDLRQQVQKAEIASEQYQKELELLQMRLDEAAEERNILDEQISQKDSEAEAVHTETKDVMRQKKELEQTHYAEKAMMLKEREGQIAKEQELQGIIQRLNETIRQKEMRAYVDGERPAMPRSGMSARIITNNR